MLRVVQICVPLQYLDCVHYIVGYLNCSFTSVTSGSVLYCYLLFKGSLVAVCATPAAMGVLRSDITARLKCMH